MFFSNIFEVKDYYSNIDLIEQISKSSFELIEIGINEFSNEYKLSIELIKTKTSELAMIIKANEYNLKLKLSGIVITYFEISELDIKSEEEEEVKENSAILKRLSLVLNKLRNNKVIIDKDNARLKLTENGEIVYKSNIGICGRCGNLLERDSKYCENCGTKI